jgi:hypothetical protein
MDFDWMGALLGAVVGAALTAGLGYVAYRRERSRVEKAAINELIRELSERRAFAIDGPRLIPDAENGQDFPQLNASVLSVRERIRETRSKLVRHHRAQRALTAMIQACNRYLERSAGDPPRYWILAIELRDELHARLQETGLKGAANVTRPGDLAFDD